MTAAQKMMGSSKIVVPRTLKLADALEGVKPDFGDHPMEEGAFGYWKSGTLRFHLTFEMVRVFAKAVGRQIRMDEIQELVGDDGPEVTCVASGKKFQPVFWIIPTKDVRETIYRCRDIVRALGELDELGKVIRLGHFFLLKDGLDGEPKPVGGNPYFVSRDGCHPDKKSAFVQASRNNAERMSRDPNRPMWGLSLMEINHRRDRRARRIEMEKEEKHRLEQKALADQRRISDNLDKLFFPDKN